ncbi:MAG: leucine-rich repeat protein [Clostridia bacterium]|nr:leucine-rich repeat protein [Clostridia bacterium]
MKIKSLVSFLLTVTMLATCFAGITMVTAEVEGDFEYIFEGDGAVLTKYKGSATTVTIPETLGGKSVIMIGEGAFYQKNVTTVAMPDTVTELGVRAFAYSSVQDIALSANLAIIRDEAFYGCDSLAAVTIPESVTVIESQAFDGCGNLISANLPENLTELGENAFNGCEKLASVITIPVGITAIPKNCFYHCYRIPQVIFHDNVEVIGQYAFTGCSSITELVLPKNLKDLDYACFSGCSAMKELTITSEYTAGFLADPFANCNNLEILNITENVTTITQDMVSFGGGSVKTVNIAEGVTKIDDNAFLNFVNMTSVSLPDTLTQIGNRSFGGCNELATITIPSSVTAIGANAFADTHLYKTTTNWEDGVLYIGDCLIEISEDFNGNLVVKDGTRLIAEGAFSFRTELTGIRLPASIQTIGDKAFNSYNYNLDTFIYNGSKEDWEKVTVGADNEKLTDLNPIYVTGGSYGDVNEDGKVDATDALEILKSIVGKTKFTARQQIVADVDLSGKGDAADALEVLKKVVGKVQLFPAEQLTVA